MHCQGCGRNVHWSNAHELRDGSIYGDGCCPGMCDQPHKHEGRNMKYRTTPRTAYLAGRFERKQELIHVEEFLKNHNIMPGTRWLHQETDMREADEEGRKRYSLINVEDVRNADFLITLSEDLEYPSESLVNGIDGLTYVPAIWARGGRHVEFGVALANGLDIVVIGPPENLFHYYDGRTPDAIAKGKPTQINHYNSIESFATWYDENNVLPEDAEAADQPPESVSQA